MSGGSKRKRPNKKSSDPVTAHREDERERRRLISDGFNRLQLYLPDSNKRRAWVDVLSEIREVVWELWRNEEVLSLYSRGMLTEAITELQRHVVVKREKLEDLHRMDAEAPISYLPPPPLQHLDETPSPPTLLKPIAEIVTENLQSKPEIIEEEIPSELFHKLVQQIQAASDAGGEYIIASEGEETTEGEEGDTSAEGSDLERQENYHQFAYMQPNMPNMLPNMLPNMVPSFRPDNTIVCPNAQFPPMSDKCSPGSYQHQRIPYPWQSVGATATLNTDFGLLIKAIEEDSESGDIVAAGEVSNVDVVN